MDDLKQRDPIPEFETLDDIAEFWDSHSLADYDDVTQPAQFNVRLRQRGGTTHQVTLLPELSETLEAIAKARGVSLETLVNVWLTEKVLSAAA